MDGGETSVRIATHLPSWLLLLFAAAPLGVACSAHGSGKGATQGVTAAIREEPPEGQLRIAEIVGTYTTKGALDRLSSPEGAEQLETLVARTVTRSLEAALRAPPGVQGRGGYAVPRSLVDRVAYDSATAVSSAISVQLERALGPNGRGPLAASLGETAAQVSGSAVRGARDELGDFFPGCDVADRRACLEAEVRSLGRAAATGFVEGIARSAAWPLLALAFAVGVVATLVVGGVRRLLREHRHLEPRGAHP
jgi:hypothetical protein